ncbi:ETS domain-containing protein Elk-3, partial [Galemys pyrenaicus]
NIIKKVIGQKFVYKFVSFPEILKMDPHSVEISRESLLLQDSDCKVPPEAREAHRHGLPALKSSSRNEYIHSGLYSSFTINSLQSPPEPFKAIKTEKLEEQSEDSPPVEEVRTVIRFVTNKTDKHISRPVVSLPSTSEAFLASSVSAKISSLMLPNAASISSASPSSSRSPSLSPNSPLPSEHRSLFLEAACRDSDPLEPLNLSSGSKTRSPSLPPKAKKPKGLEISAPPLVLSGTDIGSIALNSPALPSGSLTPAFFTAQTELHAGVIFYHESLARVHATHWLLLSTDQWQCCWQSGRTRNTGSGKKGDEFKYEHVVIPGGGTCFLVHVSPPPPANHISDAYSKTLYFPSQTPNGLLLTPSPLLSSIHFWSSLSPVAPLSPARLQGPNTLFQFPTLLNGHMPVPIPSLDRAASPVLLSSNSQKS